MKNMADEYKTLPIDTIFTYKGNKYQVCISESKFNPCALCAFQDIIVMNLNILEDIVSLLKEKTLSKFILNL